MKSFTPEISWHNRLPVLSVDLADDKLATGGNDSRVYIWQIERATKPTEKALNIQIRAGLRRHQASVGAVKFSTDLTLASGDDDGYIYIWKHKGDYDRDSNANDLSGNLFNDDGFEDLEQWQQLRVLRGHIEDICDLAWSKDGRYLLSGSVDNSAIFWDALRGTKIWCSDLIKGYVQGVALDPISKLMAVISTDRSLRIYNQSDRKQLTKIRRVNMKNKYKISFCDDTVQTFCRRLGFSPDGQFLAVPTCRVAENAPAPIEHTTTIDLTDATEVKENDIPQEKTNNTNAAQISYNAILVFKSSNFNKALAFYPTGREVGLCCKFSPILYKLKPNETNIWQMPYRIIFAVATSRSIIIYDSQQSSPIGYISQVHLARLTDLVWSNDGKFLMVSSYDGYCTFITFEEGEFGVIYDGPMVDLTEPEPTPKPPVEPVVKTPPKPIEKPENTIWNYFNKRKV